jgi:NAD(P)-dependent dehydrogenase (short-subunit alcohol dehydrogenase family)
VSPVAIVTASDSEIGQESAKELAENGFDVPFSSYNKPELRFRVLLTDDSRERCASNEHRRIRRIGRQTASLQRLVREVLP